MSSVRLDRIFFSHGPVRILERASARLGPGFTGLVGENGAGKTTVLRLVAGELAPDEGAIRIEPADATVALCAEEVDAPGADVGGLAASCDPGACRVRGLLRLDPARLAAWTSLSPGERKRWQLGAALAAAPDVLLLDEPTNHLDGEARGWLVDALRTFHGVGLLVSHDRALLEEATAATLRVADGALEAFPGPYPAARAAWDAARRSAEEARDAAQEERRRAARRLADARRERDAATASRSRRHRMRSRYDADARTLGADTKAAWAESALGRRIAGARREGERAAEEEGLAALPERWTAREVTLGGERARRPVLAALDVPALHVGGRLVLHDVRVALGRDDRVRVAGANGAGKSTLLRALVAASHLPPERLPFIPQDATEEDRERVAAEVRALPAAERGRVLALVAALGSDPARVLASPRPSPGEARKLLLAAAMGREAWGLVLDEPTNHLDLPTVERLEAALAAWPGAILLVTHDERLGRACTSATWTVVGGTVRA
jgi:ATPase subunit of ABC transporter with duplicated ATPase domains